MFLILNFEIVRSSNPIIPISLRFLGSAMGVVPGDAIGIGRPGDARDSSWLRRLALLCGFHAGFFFFWTGIACRILGLNL